MEGVVLVGLAAGAGALSILLVTSGEGWATAARLRRAMRAVLRLVVALARSVGGSGPAGWLCSHTPLSAVSRDLAGRLSRDGLAADAELCRGTALLGVALVWASVALLVGSWVGGLVAGVALLVGAWWVQGSRERRRSAAVRREMPSIYRTLAVALGSGQTLVQAVEYVGAHAQGDAAGAFGRMALRLRCGMSTESAVGTLARELDAPGTSLLATALVISHRTGSPLHDLLMRSARLVERQGEFERLLSVKTAQVRLSVRIVGALPLALVGLLAAISPDFQRGLLTPTGAACLALALVLDGLALVIIRRIVRGVL